MCVYGCLSRPEASDILELGSQEVVSLLMWALWNSNTLLIAEPSFQSHFDPFLINSLGLKVNCLVMQCAWWLCTPSFYLFIHLEAGFHIAQAVMSSNLLHSWVTSILMLLSLPPEHWRFQIYTTTPSLCTVRIEPGLCACEARCPSTEPLRQHRLLIYNL